MLAFISALCETGWGHCCKEDLKFKWHVGLDRSYSDNNWSENHPFTSLIVCMYVYIERDEYTELASTYTAPGLSIMSYVVRIPGSAVGLGNFLRK